MTYIRLTGGRDRGHVKDMPHLDAQRMLGNGQALPVDFNEPDPLGFREISAPVAEQDQDKELPALADNSTPPMQNRAKHQPKKGSR